jgi:hypothetical protein
VSPDRELERMQLEVESDADTQAEGGEKVRDGILQGSSSSSPSEVRVGTTTFSGGNLMGAPLLV